MTQEQLAEKLSVSRQTVSKWETNATSPDLDSVVKISRIFHISLNDLLLEKETSEPTRNDGQITLEDLTKINLHNRKMSLLFISGLVFLMIAILNFAYIMALRSVTVSTQYILYRYIVTGDYTKAPIDYLSLFLPSVIAGMIGLALYLCYIFESKKGA